VGETRQTKTMPPPPSSSMSFLDAIKKAKVAAVTAETKNGWDSGGQ
jgi:hypothetical protein